jgi:CBS-domain-containing membrane protein
MKVVDYMSKHLVYLRAGDHPEVARRPMIDLGLTAVPVLDEEHRPVGVVRLRDLADDRLERRTVSESVCTIPETATIDEAARILLAGDVHHAVVVDAQGCAVGMISSMDVLRALVGAPPKHLASIDRLVAVKSEDVQSEYRSE